MLARRQRGFVASLAGGSVATLVVYGVLAAVVLGAVGTIVYRVQAWGGDRVRAELAPIIRTLTLERDTARGEFATMRAERDTVLEANARAVAELARLRDLYAEQTREIERLKADAAAAEQRVRDALQKVVATEKRYTAEIARLRAIAEGPSLVEGAYEEADAILRALVRDRASGLR